jgi:hypothetical protein
MHPAPEQPSGKIVLKQDRRLSRRGLLKFDAKTEARALASGWPGAGAFGSIKLEPVGFYHRFAASNDRETSKKTQMRRDIEVFGCRLGYQACAIPRIVRASGMAGLRGPAVRYCF